MFNSQTKQTSRTETDMENTGRVASWGEGSGGKGGEIKYKMVVT